MSLLYNLLNFYFFNQEKKTKLERRADLKTILSCFGEKRQHRPMDEQKGVPSIYATYYTICFLNKVSIRYYVMSINFFMRGYTICYVYIECQLS